MGPRKGEAGSHVPCQCERGRADSLHRVATLALVPIRDVEKLALVHVGMADGAGVVRELEPGLGAPRLVTLGARYRGMFRRQLETGGCVQRSSEGRRFETLHIVAGRALSTICTPGELLSLRVIPVAIGAPAMSDWDFEIAGPVTRLAGQALMLAPEGKSEG